MSWGVTRPATWLLVAATISIGTNSPTTYPVATTPAAPATTRSADEVRFLWSLRTIASAVPTMGVMRGATIMAPITVAVLSAATPADAMIAARISRVQNVA
ncbi:hypothetical protein D3C74_295990 [compost metagenome]